MRPLLFISLALLVSGCGSTLKNSWTDFRAYYNSYYNAEKNYAAGLEKVESQQPEIDVTVPIRVHPQPLLAGGQDFQKAIDKGADILRKFPESRWIDETLQLIGKSYFYRREYYSALQKFEELYRVTGDPVMRQKAVIWKGRVLLELGQNERGVDFLRIELDQPEGGWLSEYRAEARVLLAEHYVGLRDWEQVESALRDALPELKKTPMKARAFFLLGQVMETRERYGEASFAYSRSAVNRPDFELLFWANLKQAEALRNMDNLSSASLIYEKMRRDDKNVQRLPEIEYELARTKEEQGAFRDAEQSYKRILRSETAAVPQQVRAKIYFRLGELYSRQFKQFQTAAAYYDSSATFGGALGASVSGGPDTETLARAFASYSDLKSGITRMDSLLWLGSLPESRFDSVIAEIRNRRLLEQQTSGARRADNGLAINVPGATGPGGDAGQDAEGGSSGVYGFMNYRNGRMLADAVRQFRAVWGDRRLADNWRRIEAIGTTGRDSAAGRQDGGNTPPDDAVANTGVVVVDISEVPFSEADREKMRDELAVTKYELGSLFLLTLGEPDSAAHYFRSVIEDHSGHALVPKAIYSLREVYVSRNQTDEAQMLAERLRSAFPNSAYTRKLNEQLGVPDAEAPGPGDSGGDIAGRVAAVTDSLTDAGEIAGKLRKLALDNREAPAAPQIHFEAISYYIRQAREAASVAGSDTTVSRADMDEPPSGYSFRGGYWDSVRTVLNEHQRYFADSSPTGDNVALLLDELDKPARVRGDLPGCDDLGITPEIRSGMEEFLATVGLPGGPGSGVAAQTIDYEMVIGRDGEVVSFELLSRRSSTGLEEAFDKAIENNLSFLPPGLPGSVAGVRCTISFPVRR